MDFVFDKCENQPLRVRRLNGLIALSVFAVGVVLFVSAIQAKRTAEPKSFVVTYLTTQNGTPMQFRTRVVRTPATYKDTSYGMESKKTRTIVGTFDAQYEVGANSIEFLQSTGQPWQDLDKSFRSAEYLKNHPAFVREKFVAGFNAYVHRTVNPEYPEYWVEDYISPEFGLMPLKMIQHFSDTSIVVVEAVNVQFRDVSESEVSLPNLPMQFNQAEQMIKDARANGDVEGADEQSKQIENERQKQ